MQSPENPLFGLYIHWPYCLSKCPYCDFASGICDSVNETALLQGYARDLKTTPNTGKTTLTSIFFGGGTPSLMTPHFLEKLLTLISTKYKFAPNIEISLEANPDAIDVTKMRAFADLGINRLSMGVQALNESDLHLLGRKHTVKTALDRLTEAQKYFPRLNMDLIYARPLQTIAKWHAELKQALALGLSHYSLYQLTIEQGTPFYRQHLSIPDEDLAADLYEMTNETMNAAGCPSYEVSNYAVPGQESRHNLTYWLGGDYVGIGPAAHGRLGNVTSQNSPAVSKWIKTPTTYATLTTAERFTERVLMGLRLTHHDFPVQGLNPSGIDKALSYGWITRTNDTIIPTLQGTLMLNKLIATVLP